MYSGKGIGEEAREGPSEKVLDKVWLKVSVELNPIKGF